MSVDISKVKFDDNVLVPAIVQEESGQVLMLAYMNKESLEKTIETGLTWFWSRSRQCLWQKGETSGNIQQVKEISYDCDGDTLLVRVHQRGVACHTGTYSCFSGRRLHPEQTGKDVAVIPEEPQQSLAVVLNELYDVIKEGALPESWTPYLIGMAAAAVTGYAAIGLVRFLVKDNKFSSFAYYCFVVGCATIIYFGFIR